MLKINHDKKILGDLEKLRSKLETILLKIESGQTLEHATKNIKDSIQTSTHLQIRWIYLYNAIQEGTLPAKSGLESFKTLIDIQIISKREFQKRSQNAKMQSLVISFLSLSLILILSLLQSSPLTALHNGIALSLCIAGFYLFRIIEKIHQKSLWRLDWLMFWSDVKSLIECGKTPQQSLSESLCHFQSTQNLPKELKTELDQIKMQLQSFDTDSYKISNPLKGEFTEMDTLVLEQFLCSAKEGLQSSKILRRFCDHYEKWSIRHISSRAEKLAYLNFIPLYFCFAPAIFIALLGHIFVQFILQ